MSFLTALGAAAQPPAPQTPPPPPAGDQLDDAARALFQSAREAFATGNYELALTRFRAAYEASPRPVLLYNIATTLDRLRRDEEALATLNQYLAADPNPPNKSEIEARIRVLQAAVDQRRQQQAAELEAREQAERDRLAAEEARRQAERDGGGGGGAARPAEDGGGLPPLFVLIGGGLTLVGAGVVVWSGLNTVSHNDSYEAYVGMPGATLANAEVRYNNADNAQTRTNIFIAVAAVLAAGTGALAIFTDWDGSAEVEANADPAATAATRVRPYASVGDGSFLFGASGEL